MYLPPPDYTHLLDLIDDTGIFEHTRYGVPRRAHGYTVDDAARAIVVLCQGLEDGSHRRALEVLLSMVLDALTLEGRFRNRLTFERRWLDEIPDDTQGRAVWALGVTATCAHDSGLRAAARSALDDLTPVQSPHLRPHAYAALGAHALWSAEPDDPLAKKFMGAATRFQGMRRPWPEKRLSYANGRVPAAMLAAGEVTGRDDLIELGLSTLDWLEKAETLEDRLSFTPVFGRGPGDVRPGFDQQPIEAAALADAAERAWLITLDPRWKATIFRCGAWLMGANDSGTGLYDTTTGATRDGLMEDGVNANSGAESTIAGIAVLQACERVRSAPPPGRVGVNRSNSFH